MTVRVRFADLHSVTRSITLDAPISATASLAEIAEELVRAALADYPHERIISLLGISVSQLEECSQVQLELPLGLEDEKHRPGAKSGMARSAADRAIDAIRDLNLERLVETGDPEISTRISAYEMAYRMQSSGPELIDLSGETEATLKLYGVEKDRPSFA